jgi:hypothetical protein
LSTFYKNKHEILGNVSQMRKIKLGVNNANMPNVQSKFVMFMSCGLVVNGRLKLLKYHITLVFFFGSTLANSTPLRKIISKFYFKDTWHCGLKKI